MKQCYTLLTCSYNNTKTFRWKAKKEKSSWTRLELQTSPTNFETVPNQQQKNYKSVLNAFRYTLEEVSPHKCRDISFGNH